MQSRGIGSEQRRRSLWIVTKGEGGRVDRVLTMDRAGWEVLPVFGHEEEAEAFLRLLGEAGDGWRARETAAGELTSLLFGPCADVRSVALDPPTGDGGAGFELARMDRERFMRGLIGRRGAGRSPGDGNPRGTAEAAASIPDYVMWDFGTEWDRS